MVFMSKASGKQEFHENVLYHSPPPPPPPTSCCITMIQSRAPQNYNKIIDTVIM